MRKGGLVIADNVLRPATTAEDIRVYVAHVRKAPQARSFTLDVGADLEITCKK